MKHLLPTMIVLSVFLVPSVALAEDEVVESPVPVETATALPAFGAAALPYTTLERLSEPGWVSDRDAAGVRAWKRSLIPFAASQTLDIASSYGMRELNPILAGPDGRFGAKAVSMKVGVAASIVGVEYLIVKKWPGSARVLSKLNWASSLLTGGFAAHNFAIK